MRLFKKVGASVVLWTFLVCAYLAYKHDEDASEESIFLQDFVKNIKVKKFELQHASAGGIAGSISTRASKPERLNEALLTATGPPHVVLRRGVSRELTPLAASSRASPLAAAPDTGQMERPVAGALAASRGVNAMLRHKGIAGNRSSLRPLVFQAAAGGRVQAEKVARMQRELAAGAQALKILRVAEAPVPMLALPPEAADVAADFLQSRYNDMLSTSPSTVLLFPTFRSGAMAASLTRGVVMVLVFLFCASFALKPKRAADHVVRHPVSQASLPSRRDAGSEDTTKRSEEKPSTVSTASECGMPPPMCPNLVLPVSEVRFAVPLSTFLSVTTGEFHVVGLLGSPLLRAGLEEVPNGKQLQLAMSLPRSLPRATVRSIAKPGSQSQVEIWGPNNRFYGFIEQDSNSLASVIVDNTAVMKFTGDCKSFSFNVVSGRHRPLATVLHNSEDYQGIEHVEVRVIPVVDPVLVLACVLALLLLTSAGSQPRTCAIER
eukprot:gnl/TRDRNA2_/TRDRNA2_181343_c0_seq1.p1 gnl/TRDRNA2_/TRDRNA2_181343_c0~~gnl/TRDRNA2_/TRDRNA2_181343_c0_seq1.p1  ORF type:complete len:492 (+),score=96.24 gnl/TRDRNA2_/TRDRNA2_181343_c0_seq1:86-1561(+)